MSSSLTQCWFCHSLNITVPDSPTPCRVCGLLPKHARPDTSAVVMSPQEHAALIEQVAASSFDAIISGHQGAASTATPGVPAPGDDATSILVRNALVAETSTPAGRWVIETEAGDIVPLPCGDVVVGRQPKAVEGAVPVALTDVAKTLSKSHARLRYDATRRTWTVEDLASTNGVVTLVDDIEQPVAPNVATPFREYLAFGMLRCRVIYL